MILCDAAQLADGKLFIMGGGWNVMGPDPVPTAIAVKLDVGWHETEDLHHWELYLEDADGRPVPVVTPEGEQPVEARGEFRTGRPADLPEGSPVGVSFVVNIGPLPLPPASRFSWRLVVDGEAEPDWELSFFTAQRPQPPAA